MDLPQLLKRTGWLTSELEDCPVFGPFLFSSILKDALSLISSSEMLLFCRPDISMRSSQDGCKIALKT